MFGFGKPYRLFRLWGVDVDVDAGWMIVFGFFVYIGSGFYSGGLFWKVAIGVLFAVVFYLGLFIHEFSHTVVAKLRGIPVRRMQFSFLGAGAFIEKQPRSPKEEFLIGIAGPLASFAIALIFWIAYVFVGPVRNSEVFSNLVEYLIIINVVLGAFNLLPAYPLDGGRCFARAFLWTISHDPKKSMRQACRLGELFGRFFIFLGIVGLILILIAPGHVYWNFIWMAVLGWFLINAAKGSWRAYILSCFTARDCMQPIDQQTAAWYLREGSKVVPEDTTLDKVLQVMHETDLIHCLVEDGSGKIIGMIDPRSIMKIVAQEEKL